MRRLLTATLLLLGAVSATVTSALAASPPPGIGIRLISASASEPSDPRARLYIVDHLAPGTVSHRQVEVANSTNSTLVVSAYPAGAAVANGSFAFAPDRAGDELTTWIAVDRGSLTMKPHTKTRVKVTFNVPRDAAPGERYAVIWAEVRSAPAPGTGVVVINRVGVRVYLLVGAGNPPAPNFEITSIKAGRTKAGQPTVTAHVLNTGGRTVDIGGNVRLSHGPGGISAGPFSAQQVTTLAPGQSGEVTAVLDKKLPSGPWTVSMDLKSGLIEQSHQATIQFPGVGPKAAPRSYLVPALVGGGILAVVVLGMLAQVIHRRRRPGSIQDSTA